MEKIVVENFKAIRNLERKEIHINHLTLLMGEQAAGKSTVAKLIYFFKTLPNELLTEAIGNTSGAKLQSMFKSRLKRYFIYLFGSTRHLQNFTITYWYPSGVELEIRKDPESGNLTVSNIKRLDMLNSDAIKAKNSLTTSFDKFDSFSRRERERAIDLLSAAINEVFGIKQNALYMPASRNMTVVLEPFLTELYSKLENTVAKLDLKDPQRFQSENEFLLLLFMQYTLNLKSKFKKSGGFTGLIEDEIALSPADRPLLTKIIGKIQDALKGRYEFDQYGEKIFYEEGSFVYLNNASSGQQEIIRPFQDIFLSILQNDIIFRVYEEPESHLSPSSQKAFIELISLLINHNDHNQVVIPTHTPYILRVIDNLIKAAAIMQEKNGLEGEVSKVIDESYWLNFSKISAYNLENGEIHDASNPEFKAIEAPLFDYVSEQIANDFDTLLNIQYP